MIDQSVFNCNHISRCMIDELTFNAHLHLVNKLMKY